MPTFKPIQQGPRFTPTEDFEQEIEQGEVQRLPQEDPGGTLGERLRGLGQAGASLGRSMVAEPVAGYAGILEMMRTSLKGEGDPLTNAAEAVESTRSVITGEPSTDVGKKILSNIIGDEDMRRLAKDAREKGVSVFEMTDSPAAGAAVETVLTLLPELASAKPGFRAVPRLGGAKEPEVGPPRSDQERVDIIPEKLGKARREDIKRVSKILDKEGIDVSSRKRLMESLERKAKSIQEPGFADSLKRVRDAVIKNKEAELKLERAWWKEAREGGEGTIRPDQITNFRNYLDEALDGYEVSEMPMVNKLLKRFDEEVNPVPNRSAAKISALYRWRKSLNRNMPPEGTPDRGAMVTMKRNLDHFLQTQFAADMVKGDQASIARWRKAIDKSAEIRKVFEDEKFMRQLARNGATPEELRNFIFNASSVGMKAESGRLIKNLKQVLGEDSPEFKGLRNESSFNLMEPILQEFPDYKAFMKRYEDFVRRNPTALEELWPENAQKALKSIYSAAKSAKSRRSFRNKLETDLHRAPATIFFGHGIAQAGLKVRIAKNIMDQVFQAETTPIKQEILRDFLDYDPTKSAFRDPMKRAAVLGSVTAAAQEQAEEGKTAREGMR